MSKLIPTEQFKTVVEYTPLISINLVTMYQDKVLLGKRVNKPALGFYFTTGGIVRENESLTDVQKRIAKDELGIELTKEVEFIGVFEHFYDDGIFDDISTYYVNHGHFLQLDKEITKLPQKQHNEYRWFTIEELMNSNEVHKYVKDYFKNLNLNIIGENK